jgi:hypothetical protein
VVGSRLTVSVLVRSRGIDLFVCSRLMVMDGEQVKTSSIVIHKGVLYSDGLRGIEYVEVKGSVLTTRSRSHGRYAGKQIIPPYTWIILPPFHALLGAGDSLEGGGCSWWMLLRWTNLFRVL